MAARVGSRAPMAKPDLAAVLAYHEASKHRLPNRYARSAGHLDWDNQPNPFRLYAGADQLPLIRPDSLGGPSLDAVYDPSRITAAPVNPASIAQLLYDSLALSAWKQAGSSRWSLRCNPSSGNLHPTEAYVITGPIAGLSESAALWHYTPLLHALERRASFDASQWAALSGDGEGIVIALTSIFWREAWKYGERAFRYCQHDVGHALAALSLAAGALGWHSRVQANFDDADVARLLGLPDPEGPEAEHADVLVFIGPRLPGSDVHMPDSLPVEFAGTPNRLSESHREWPILEQVAAASARVGPMTLEVDVAPASREPSPVEPAVASARELVRTRRSAVAMDGETTLARAAWLRMLARVMPRPGHAPFAGLLGRARVHLLLFVHRVDDVAPGLYLLVRDPSRRESIAASLRDDLRWTSVDTGALDLPLFLLDDGDTRLVAALLACRQEIAADGAFAVAMLAELEPALREHGPWMYRHLHWEAGAIGQVLYLEAEASQVRATGIGCFFDDGVHELLGISDAGLQSIYHFTVGGPVEDTRLQVLAAYHHLDSGLSPR